MPDNYSLLSWMKDQGAHLHNLSLPLHNHQFPSLLERMSAGRQSPNHQPVSLLTQMDNPVSLQRPHLNQNRESIRRSSLTAMPSSKRIARGRSPKLRYTSKSNPSLPERLVMTEEDQTQHLAHSWGLLRATTPKLQRQRAKGERSTRYSAPPALQY